MVEINIFETDHRLICDLTEEDIAVRYSRANETDGEDDRECWVPSVEEDRAEFNIFDEFEDEE